MDEIYAKEICKLGMLDKCCSYLAMGQKGFECLKNSGLKSIIDERRAAGTMHAKGDNCKSFLVETTNETIHTSPKQGPWGHKICQCSKCSTVQECTITNDFYDDGENGFLCESCFLKMHNFK